jgi:AcrR family transcriptional regulator
MLHDALASLSRRGYDQASMEVLATDLGVTRPTIYRHFGSKSELVRQIISAKLKQFADALSPDVDTNLPVEHVLFTLGRHVMEFMQQDEMLQLYRLIHQIEAHMPELARRFLESSHRTNTDMLVSALRRLSNRNALEIENYYEAAYRFRVLCQPPLSHLHLSGDYGGETLSADQWILNGVRAFLKIYEY